MTSDPLSFRQKLSIFSPPILFGLGLASILELLGFFDTKWGRSMVMLTAFAFAMIPWSYCMKLFKIRLRNDGMPLWVALGVIFIPAAMIAMLLRHFLNQYWLLRIVVAGVGIGLIILLSMIVMGRVPEIKLFGRR